MENAGMLIFAAAVGITGYILGRIVCKNNVPSSELSVDDQWASIEAVMAAHGYTRRDPK